MTPAIYSSSKAPLPDLATQVRARLGAHGTVHVSWHLGHPFSISWRREYPGEQVSDWRAAEGASVEECLRKVLAYEDAADASDAKEDR